MGELIERLLGSPTEREPSDYAPVDFRSERVTDAAGAAVGLRFATVRTQQHLLQVRDAVYAGDIVVTEVSKNPKGGLSRNRVINDLRLVVDEVDGDIARRGRDTYIIAPRSVTLHRDSIGSSQ